MNTKAHRKIVWGHLSHDEAERMRETPH